MSTPASQSFRKDRRVTTTLMVVYQFLYEYLDACEPRECKAEWIAAELEAQDKKAGVRQAGLPARGKIDRADVDRSLNKLAEWGYLIEHNKRPDRPRWFTLAHSVRADLRVAV